MFILLSQWAPNKLSIERLTRWGLRFRRADQEIINTESEQSLFADINSRWGNSEFADARKTDLAVRTSAILLNALEIGKVDIKLLAALIIILDLLWKILGVWERMLRRIL